MKIAIASGKGGTGKTTISVALALVAPQPVHLLDCDVEEPNAHIFLRVEDVDSTPVTVPVPRIDEGKCLACGKCAAICQFNAIVSLGSQALVFPELCHSCGGCAMVCPSGAITETGEKIGSIDSGRYGHITLVQGRMSVGQAMSGPIIRAVKRHVPFGGLTIIDSPPGTSCPMIMAVLDADYVILVTEPTPFGLNDLKLAVETVRELGIPFGVVVNRADAGDSRVVDYCAKEMINILLQIPQDRKVAEAYSRGESIVAAMPGLDGSLREVLQRVELQPKRCQA